ncbi:disulfide isomerase DsbC N-terminal domain-containing protein [Methylobacillus sp. Pita2]|uniref:disulfide isomerase DsbC N-terminal domain-containing protein n=1 Tax=Methylobacillus sp. Pita2 TaxID=3383245 RepID=UPI0038B5B69B
MKKTLLAISVLFISASSCAYADAANGDGLGKAGSQIEKTFGAKVLKVTPARAIGLNAILAEKDGKQRVFYETRDGNYLFYGMVYDREGNVLTPVDVAALNGKVPPAQQPQIAAQAVAQQPQAAQPTPPALNAAQALLAAKKANYISEGTGKPVYVVFDPNCPYCKSLHYKTRSLLKNNEIRWIPVGVLTPAGGDSQRKAAAYIRGNVPVPSFELLQPVEPSATENKKVNDNLRVLVAANSNQVPVVIWEDQGKANMVNSEPTPAQMNQIFAR